MAQAHFAGETLFETLEDMALATLDDLPLVELRTRLDGMSAPVTVPDPGGTHGVLGPAGNPGAVLAARTITVDTIWSARMDQGRPLMQTRGLPVGRELQALFDMTAPLWTPSLEVSL